MEDQDATLALPTPEHWQTWLDAIKAASEIWVEQVTKSGKRHQVNLRDRLFELELIPPNSRVLLPTALSSSHVDRGIVLRYVGSCRNDGTLLRPSHLVAMLEQVSHWQFQLLHSHRNQLILF